MKILPEIYLWNEKVPFKFLKSSGPGLGLWADPDRTRLGGGLRSPSVLVVSVNLLSYKMLCTRWSNTKINIKYHPNLCCTSVTFT